MTRFMDYLADHLRNLYGLNPDMPHVAFQFPRLPPRRTGNMFNTHENPAGTKLASDMVHINKRLQAFQQMYQKYASGLFEADHMIVPPGHPMYSNSGSLRAENDKLIKENAELRKRLAESKDGQAHKHTVY